MSAPTYTVLTRRQARAATKARTAYRKAERAETRAANADAPHDTMVRLAAACDRTLRAFWQAMQGVVPAVKRTARNRALGGFAALATVGKAFAMAFARVARNARRRVAAALARAAHKARKVARVAVRRVVGRVVARVLAALPRMFAAPLALVPLLLVLAAMSDPRPTLKRKDTPMTQPAMPATPALLVTARAREIAVATATPIYDDAARTFRDNPSVAAYTALEQAAVALQAARYLAIGDAEWELNAANHAIERAARTLHHLRETRVWVNAAPSPERDQMIGRYSAISGKKR